jgi:hypothetical protein
VNRLAVDQATVRVGNDRRLRLSHKALLLGRFVESRRRRAAFKYQQSYRHHGNYSQPQRLRYHKLVTKTAGNEVSGNYRSDWLRSDSIKLRMGLATEKLIISVACLYVIVSAPALAETTAANVTKLDSKAFAASSARGTRKLRKNDRLLEQEHIITGKDISIEITFTDGTNLILGASTIVTLDSYAYKKKRNRH